MGWISRSGAKVTENSVGDEENFRISRFDEDPVGAYKESGGEGNPELSSCTWGYLPSADDWIL